MFSESFNIPSGKRLHISYVKSPCFMGKSTINIYQWAIFNSYVADQRISPSRWKHGDFPRFHRGLRSRLRRRARTAASQDPARSGDAKVCREISPAIIHVVRVVHVISPNYGYITKLWLFHVISTR